MYAFDALSRLEEVRRSKLHAPCSAVVYRCPRVAAYDAHNDSIFDELVFIMRTFILLAQILDGSLSDGAKPHFTKKYSV